jgi:hypothetical protein
MPSQFVILTVASAGVRMRPQFTFQLPTSLIAVTIDCSRLFIDYDNNVIEITDSLVAYKKNGRITHPLIHQWILDKRLNLTNPRNPAKLIFAFSIVRKRHLLKFYIYQANLINI